MTKGRLEVMNEEGLEIGFGDLGVRVLERIEKLRVAIGSVRDEAKEG